MGSSPDAFNTEPLALADISDDVQLIGASGCYLFHLSAPLGTSRKQASHYLGYSDDIARRIDQHRAGRKAAACFTRAAVKAGIELVLVRVWPGATRDDEARLKHRRASGGSQPEHARLCPICRTTHLLKCAERMRAYRARHMEAAP